MFDFSETRDFELTKEYMKRGNTPYVSSHIARTVEDGRSEEEVFEISVRDSVACVKKCLSKTEKTICFSHKEAIRVFFDLNSLFSVYKQFSDWLPLQFIIDGPDCF